MVGVDKAHLVIRSKTKNLMEVKNKNKTKNTTKNKKPYGSRHPILVSVLQDSPARALLKMFASLITDMLREA